MMTGSQLGIVAHRGASAIAPENTLAAFATALDLGVTIIETDIRAARDGELVLCGGNGPSVRAATCQDGRGDFVGYLRLCADCEGDLSDAAFRERLRDHLGARMAVRR